MLLIQRALSQAMSGASEKIFPVMFGQFLASVGTFEVKNFLQF